MALALCLLAACASDPATPPAASAPLLTDVEVPWILPDAEPAPDVSLAALEDALQDALIRTATFDPEPVLAAYRDLADGADAACPALFQDGDVTYWLDQCTAASGTRFDGFGVDARQVLADGAATAVVETVGGVATVSRDDARLTLDGFVQRAVTDDGAGVSTTLFVSGAFDTDHPAAAGSWVDEGVEPDLVITAYAFAGTPLATIVDGALVGLPGAFPVVAFDAAALVEPASGIGDCGLEPAGTVSVLDADGRWLDLVFDPAIVGDVVVTDGGCDGCARAWAGAEDLGEVCLDFGSWLGR